MTTLEALIFDVDGTLVDTEELHRQAFNQAFLGLGVGWDWPPETYARLLAISGGPDRIRLYIDHLDLPAAERVRLHNIAPALHHTKTRIYGELLEAAAARLRPGVRRLVEAARDAGLRIGLAATSASANVERLVSAAFGSVTRPALGAVVCADQVARRKPAPDVYLTLLKMLRVEAGASVAFEDSANGVAAAKAAGLRTVATPSRWTLGQDFRAADLVLPSLGDPDEPWDAATAQRMGGAQWLELPRVAALLAP